MRVVLNTKYDIETISQKQDDLHALITNLNVQKEINSAVNVNSQPEIFFEMLPIINEIGLKEFEEKLSIDVSFKLNLVFFFLNIYVYKET